MWKAMSPYASEPSTKSINGTLINCTAAVHVCAATVNETVRVREFKVESDYRGSYVDSEDLETPTD